MGLLEKIKNLRGGGGGFGRKNRRGSSTMDQDAGADPDADIIRNMWSQEKLIPPKSDNKRHWDQLLFYLACYLCITLPLLFAFKINPHTAMLVRLPQSERRLITFPARPTAARTPPRAVLQVVDYCIDGLFFIDIFVSASPTLAFATCVPRLPAHSLSRALDR